MDAVLQSAITGGAAHLRRRCSYGIAVKLHRRGWNTPGGYVHGQEACDAGGGGGRGLVGSKQPASGATHWLPPDAAILACPAVSSGTRIWYLSGNRLPCDGPFVFYKSGGSNSSLCATGVRVAAICLYAVHPGLSSLKEEEGQGADEVSYGKNRNPSIISQSFS